MQSIFEKVTIKDLFEVGAHLGHKTRFWNPKMVSYIYGASNTKTHIIDLQKTVPMMKAALKEINEVVANSGRVLFVGTKMQACDIIKEEASRCGQHYVNLRWPSGMFTNWNTVSKSIKKLAHYEKLLEQEGEVLSKKERLSINRKRERIDKYLGGVRRMGGLPSIVFVIDPKKEYIAVEEANKLNIPVVAIVDTNCDPSKITYPIPGNDDSLKCIGYYCKLVADAVLVGIERELQRKQKKDKKDSVDEADGKSSKTGAADRPRRGASVRTHAEKSVPPKHKGGGTSSGESGGEPGAPSEKSDVKNEVNSSE
ncbi:ribosomal protein S2 [Neorickettsia helminthoeca str. Oregon]|uniref:Small ribosomal subunit protein uS2 n=1 Tax=Neorickettsia helminthoeca str. Oregon TaxID=1286528 RepID=X5HL41_9RICK|nr:30S ribosomal protein S2 [Neorickettsia helminthoeca]AHX11824.1 ribosomal protein S2 [Neorickettsia helminthoeca str. Oregon]